MGSETMTKRIWSVLALCLISGSVFAELIWVNLATGVIGIPARIDNITNPQFAPEFLLSKGYRQADPPAAPAPGYERLAAVSWVQDPQAPARAVPEYHDTLIADREAREYAQDLTNNFSRYVYQNTFLLMCDSLKGQDTHEKLTMDELTMLALVLRKTDKTKYENTRDGLTTINAALIRYDVGWWDNCSWNTNGTVVIAATNLFYNLQQ